MNYHYGNDDELANILIVDDNPRNLGMMCKMLEAKGYELSFARSGEEALEIVSKLKPDLILLDVSMPNGINGFETCERLKKLGTYRDIPIIFLTAALTEDRDIVKGFEKGAVDYIVKPVKDEVVSARIQTHLKLQSEIKKRKRIEKSYKENERKLSTLLSHLPGMVYRCKNNKEWTMEFVSDRGKELTGFEPKQFTEQKVGYIDLIAEEDRKRIWDEVQIAVKEKRPYELFYKIRTAEKKIKYVWERGEGIFKDDSIAPIALEGFITDITDQEKTKSLLLKAKDEAESANKMKSAFLANMSHEIRTPMNSVLGYAQILKRDPKITLDQLESLEIIDKSGNELLNLLDEIIDISKLEAGVLKIVKKDFDLAELLEGMHQRFKVMAAKKAIDWQIDTKLGETAKVYGAVDRLRQVLNNLIENAIKYTDTGRVNLIVEREKEDVFKFRITDTGRGVPLSEHQNIFDRFHQVDYDSCAGGTGLGLPLSRDLVKLMGSELKLDYSRLNKGSSFSFSLHLPASSKLIEKRLRRQGQVSRIKSGFDVSALVVDDIKENRNVLSQLLTIFGINVRVAGSGIEALEKLKESTPDIVFLDIKMPGKSGNQVFYEAKKMLGVNDIVWIAVTASVFSEENVDRDYIQKGFDNFIAKPYRPEAISSVIEKFLKVEFDYLPNKPDLVSPDFVAQTLPDSLYQQLKSAAEVNNHTRIKKLLAEVKGLDEEKEVLANHLERLIENYQIEEFLNELEKVPHD